MDPTLLSAPAGVDLARVAAIHEREAAAFAAARPRSRALA